MQKKRNIFIDLNLLDLWDLYQKQNKKCIYTNLNIQFKSRYYQSHETTASIDRIDSNKDYTIDNIQFVHKDINQIKWNFSIQQFIYYCNLVINPLIPRMSYDCFPTKQHKNFKGYKNITKNYYNNILKHTYNRKILFNINIEDMWTKFIDQNGCCALTGLPLTLNKLMTASLDRIDSSKEYTLNNIQWLHKDLNTMKWDLVESYFKNLCRLVVENYG